MRMNLRNPAWVIIGLLQPILYLLLFGPLLGALVGTFGADNDYSFLVPGTCCCWSRRSSWSPSATGSGCGRHSSGSSWRCC